MARNHLAVLLIVGLAGGFGLASSKQGGAAQQDPQPVATEDPATDVPGQVDVAPTAADEDIATRLTRILTATEWFDQPAVRVDQGVVFLNGNTDSKQHQEWATRLAQNTEDVVAVVNRITVTRASIWDVSPAFSELEDVASDIVQSSPLILIGVALLVATWLITKLIARGATRLLRGRLKSQLLRSVISRAVAVPVFLSGLYLVLRVSGLTQLAMTVVGGTGLLGLLLGFAFRDIAENFLASVLLSIQHPFAGGDLVEVAGHTGYVQSVNMRSTLLMTLDGNHVQIPNATIYKETITNFTANPNARSHFGVGIGYDDSIAKAQSVALSVLREHPAIVNDPEPHVLVEGLGAATVNLRVYFWVDIAKYSLLKVNSAIIRLTKQAFDEAGISMPDEAREVVFPAGVPVRMLTAESDNKMKAATEQDRLPGEAATLGHPPRPARQESTVHAAEGDLSSEAEEINQQAKHSRSPEVGENFLAQ